MACHQTGNAPWTGTLAHISDVRNGSLAAPLDDISLMSAFPESGRSNDQKYVILKVRFRPKGDIGASEVTRVNRGRKFLQEYNGSPRDSLT